MCFSYDVQQAGFFLYPSLFTFSAAILHLDSFLPCAVSLNPQRNRTNSGVFDYYQMFSVIQLGGSAGNVSLMP